MRTNLRQALFILAFLIIGATMLFGCDEPGKYTKMTTNDTLGIEVYSLILDNQQEIYISRFKQKIDTINMPEINTVSWRECEDTRTKVSVIIQNKDSVVIFRK